MLCSSSCSAPAARRCWHRGRLGKMEGVRDPRARHRPPPAAGAAGCRSACGPASPSPSPSPASSWPSACRSSPTRWPAASCSSSADSAARSQAFNNARFVKDRLRDPKADVGRVINDVRTEGGGFAVVHYNGHWFPQSAGLGQDAAARRTCATPCCSATAGASATTAAAIPYLAIGLYVAANDAAYFEVFPNANLQRTMSVIGTSLAVGATVTALAVGRPRLVGQPPPPEPAVARGRRRQRAGRGRPRHPPARGVRPRPRTGWSARSTTWPTPCRTASSARPGSPPT